MTTVLHTADTHLGYKQYHQQERQQDFNDAFKQVIDAAIQDEVDAVVHAGDLFHDSRPNTSAILTVVEQLQKLEAADIPFLMVVGNHEDTHESQWGDIFQQMSLATRLNDSPTIVNDTAFYGLDYVPTTRRAQLDYQFDTNNADYSILVGHGGFEPLSIHDDWNAEHVLGRTNIDFDAFLLGDDHTPKIQTVSGVPTTYPGSTERTAHDQRDDRVYNNVAIGGFSDGVEITQQPLDTREFIYLDYLELDEEDTAQQIRTAINNTDLTDAIVIITIDGDGEPFQASSLEEQALEEGALVARVRDARNLEMDDVDFEVSFADPDAAVDRKLRETDLSVVGNDIDHLVRDLDGVAETNIADEVKSKMDERVSESPEDFTTTADLEPLDNEAEDSESDADTTDNTDTANTGENTSGTTSERDAETKRELVESVMTDTPDNVDDASLAENTTTEDTDSTVTDDPDSQNNASLTDFN